MSADSSRAGLSNNFGVQAVGRARDYGDENADGRKRKAASEIRGFWKSCNQSPA